MAATVARGRPPSFDRQQALDRAIRVFWSKGYESTSVRDLSTALGIGLPSLYNTFGDKRALFTEAVDAYDQTYGGFIDAALAEEPTAERAIHRIITEAPARYTRRGLPRGCLIVSGDEGTTDDVIHLTLRRQRRRNREALAAKVAADVAAGVLPDTIDPAGLADYVMTLLGGIAQRARDGATRDELTTVARIAARSIASHATGGRLVDARGDVAAV